MATLNVKQKAFCQEYAANGGNAKQAYYKAGYKPKNDNAAAAASARLLTNVNVMAYIEELNAKVESAKIMSIEEAQQRLTAIGRRDKCELYDKEGIAFQGRPSATEAIRAIELLLRSQGAFLDKKQIELGGIDGSPLPKVEIYLPDNGRGST